MPTTHTAVEQRQEQVYALTRLVRTHLPVLPRPTARTLALFAFAACIVRSASVLRCAAMLCLRERAPLSRLRQRLREFYLDAHHKRGRARRTLEVQTCFAGLAEWARRVAAPTGPLVLALDPTLCRDRLACLCVSIVSNDLAIPVAWRIVAANTEGAWMPAYAELLVRLHASLMPSTRPVYVLCDRGLFSKPLYEAVRALGWHPLFRIPANGYWITRRCTRRLSGVLSRPGQCYGARGRLHKKHPLCCTLVGLWHHGYDEPWLVVTDEAPARAHAHLYGLRFKIERVFRTAKSDVFGWQTSRITAPERAERMWLVYAVGMLLMAMQAQQIEHSGASLRQVGLSRSDVWEGLCRRLSVVRVGQIGLWAMLLGRADEPSVSGPAYDSS